MGTDLYLMTEPDIDEANAVCRNIANEIDVLELLAEKGGALMDHITYGDEDEPQYVDAKTMVPVIKKTERLASKLADSKFNHGKEGFLEDLSDLLEATEVAPRSPLAPLQIRK